MTPENKKILSRVRQLEAWSSGLHEEAIKLRKELEGIDSPAPRKGRKPVVSDVELARVHAKRLKRIH